MPTYRLTAPGEPPELLEADTCRREGIHIVLRGTTLVIGRPREIVLRRVPANVLVEEVDEEAESGGRLAAAGRLQPHEVAVTDATGMHLVDRPAEQR